MGMEASEIHTPAVMGLPSASLRYMAPVRPWVILSKPPRPA